MAVTISEPEAALARRAANHRAGIGKTRPCSKPRRRLDRIAKREEFVRPRQYAIELHWRRRRIARSEFRASREPDALFHRRQAIAVVGVENRPIQSGIALRAVVAVIAALDGKRQLDAKRFEQIRRPRS